METSASSKTMNNPTKKKFAMPVQNQGIENPMREQAMGTQTSNTASSSKQKLLKRCTFCAAFLALTLTAPRLQAAAVSNPNSADPAAEEQQGKQHAGDRIVVTLSDPSRPSTVKASLINGADAIQRPIDLTIQVPIHTSLHLRAVNDGDIMVSGVDGELDIDNVNGSVTLTKIAGSAVAHALNGKLIASFTRVNQKPMAFSSLNGDIDVTFPADLKATVSLKSDNGDVFSDFDVNMLPQSAQTVVEDGRSHGGKYKVKIDKTVRGTINGGGPEMQFTNFNGGIYIRKAGSK